MTESDYGLAEMLKQAEGAVDEAAVAQDLRPAAFTAAFSMLSGTSPHGAERLHGSIRKSAPLTESGGPILSTIAAKLGLDADDLSYVYEEDDGDLRLAVRRGMLPPSRAAAMRDSAQLVMVGRQLAGIGEWTTYEQLRNECAELGVLDSGNFATEIQTLDIRQQGDRNSREARLTRHGIDGAAALLRRMIEAIRSSADSD